VLLVLCYCCSIVLGVEILGSQYLCGSSSAIPVNSVGEGLGWLSEWQQFCGEGQLTGFGISAAILWGGKTGLEIKCGRREKVRQGQATTGDARQVNAKQGRAGQGRAGQGRAGQGRAGQGRAGQALQAKVEKRCFAEF
jgi:hypothetical protein